MRGGLHKLATWFGLVAYLLSGISPAQQLVVCLEPDGSVVLEAAEASGCTPCDGTEDPSPQVTGLRSACCACIDIPLPRQGEGPQAKPKASEDRGSWAAVVPPAGIGSITGIEPVEREPSVRARPRPAPNLALIRTVVLRV
jgi:hypothetical protein